MKTAKQAKEEARHGRLAARPEARRGSTEASHGLQRLNLGAKRDGLLYVPRGYRATHPAPLVLMLHGAGGNAQNGLNPLRALADDAGLILLSVDSRGRTWDVISGEYGPDVEFIDRALEHTFERCAVDTKHIAVEGFSDGASYALSLGIINGDLFTHVVAFSPGFMVPTAQRGTPRVYISHGDKDSVLPIDRCSRVLVPRLKRAGYDVHYHEFKGPHTVPAEVAREAVNWFLGKTNNQDKRRTT